MAPAWVKRLRDAVTPPPFRTIEVPEPDPDHERHLAEARRQGEQGDRQMKEAKRITQPLVEAAHRLSAAGDRNHFSEQLEEMLKKGYGHPRGDHR